MGDVSGHVAEVDAQTDHRSLMRDELDPAERAPHRGWVAHVADHVLDVELRRPQVEHNWLETPLERRLYHVRADEAGAASNHHAGHGDTVGRIWPEVEAPSRLFSAL